MPLTEENCVHCEVGTYIIKIHCFRRVKGIDVDRNDLSDSQILTKTPNKWPFVRESDLRVRSSIVKNFSGVINVLFIHQLMH